MIGFTPGLLFRSTASVLISFLNLSATGFFNRSQSECFECVCCRSGLTGAALRPRQALSPVGTGELPGVGGSTVM